MADGRLLLYLCLAAKDQYVELLIIFHDRLLGVQDVLMWAGLSQPVTSSLPQDLSHLCPRVFPLMARRWVAAHCQHHVHLCCKLKRVCLGCMLVVVLGFVRVGFLSSSPTQDYTC